ncbi:MAG: glycosyltransferase family 2 protein, partial [Dehalococcoidia bacterium]|nr:glycosyltransferase family 2 protein [Dehalococcoidia bacterium]
TEKATQEYVVHIDSDVFLAEGALATLLSEFRGSDCASMHALGELRPQGNKLSYWESAQEEHARLSWALSGQQPRLGTAFCIFRRETILKYGFESGYGGGLDDIDLEMRLRKDGRTLGVSSARVYFHYRADLKSFFRTRFLWGRVAAGYVRKYGVWHARFWPPLRTVFWLGACVVKRRPRLVPYFVVDGIAGTTGMVKGFFELAGDASRKTAADKGPNT